MSFSPVRNVRIRSLTPGAVVQLRFGKAAVKSPDDLVVEAKLVSHSEDGDKHIVTFEETAADGQKTEVVISHYPGAPWRAGNSSAAGSQYVSLIAVDESTFTIQKPAGPVQTDALAEAIAFIQKEFDDVYGAEQLIALITHIKDGPRINTGVKSLANQFAVKLVDELKNLPPRENTDEGEPAQA